MLLILGAQPGHGARLVALRPPLAPAVVALGAVRTVLFAQGSQPLELPVRLEEAVQIGPHLYGFSSGAVYEIGLDGQLAPLADLAQPVRAAGALDERRALVIRGGSYQGRRLIGAEVAVWEPANARFSVAQSVARSYNPVGLRSGLPRGAQLALVLVEKTAVFDPVLRLRPFLYALGGQKLRPLWKGTSFARPFLDAAVADVLGQGGDELVALEDLAKGQRVLTAYHWTGAMVEGVGSSAPGNWGSSLSKVSLGEREGLIVFEKAPRRCRAVLWKEGNTESSTGVSMLQVTAATAWMPQEPLAWTVRETGTPLEPSLVALEREWRMRVRPFVAQ